GGPRITRGVCGPAVPRKSRSLLRRDAASGSEIRGPRRFPPLSPPAKRGRIPPPLQYWSQPARKTAESAELGRLKELSTFSHSQGQKLKGSKRAHHVRFAPRKRASLRCVASSVWC